MHASHPHKGLTDNMRLGYVGRYVPTSVKVYPELDTIDEYGGKISLDGHGCVLVSGENKHTHNKFINETTTGFKFKTSDEH
jgi:non-heme Fe2+,alpha-ketoglutarate-dependent halogenase